ncbi:hypothetical protein COY51_04980 [Candidatus Desantisbacteria bacterium CG_4_10_14_0_8_um_filter_39_17]|uniref:WbqC family protein n=1 Tax=Candidatus Desantisbacteria bacterium CG_4_10_14_0_8_um_filter_39_17 TaxID=1974542 RepID=A0A2H9PBU8_9BACT|nr:MAG: hypothetical protein COY51_04980 [Candidatus Desantisbacteria bacterium CG_4_10_14_0_8_um_filter_39_17]
MIIAIHQPQYLPWLGYFDKIDKSDKFVLLDDVQFKKNEWQNRNRIKTAGSGGWQWITVPVIHRFGQKINEVKINNQENWCKKHLHQLETNYFKSPHFPQYYDFLKETYARKWENLSEVNIYFIEYLTKTLGIKKQLVKSSDLKVSGEKTDRLVNICKMLNANIYLSGVGAKEYIEIEKFEKEKIKVIFQDFHHPVYKQLYGEFIPNLSVVDLLFNYGDESLKILRGNTEHLCT